MSYIWDITDPSGKRVNRITGEEITPAAPAAKDPWGSVTPAVTQVIADKVASSLGAWAPTQPKPTPVARLQPSPAVAGWAGAARWHPPVGAAVTSSGVTNATTASLAHSASAGGHRPNVVGAPGDGNAALAAALQREFARQGASQIGQPGSAYKVEGKVTVGAVKDGKQPIQIDWKVVDAQGKAVGTVTRRTRSRRARSMAHGAIPRMRPRQRRHRASSSCCRNGQQPPVRQTRAAAPAAHVCTGYEQNSRARAVYRSGPACYEAGVEDVSVMTSAIPRGPTPCRSTRGIVRGDQEGRP